MQIDNPDKSKKDEEQPIPVPPGEEPPDPIGDPPDENKHPIIDDVPSEPKKIVANSSTTGCGCPFA